MDENLVEAFQKLEAKLQREKERVLQEEKADQLRIKQAQAEKERKRQELFIYAGSLSFLLVIFYIIYSSNQAQIAASGGVGAWVVQNMDKVSAASLGSPRKDEVDCSVPDNWKKPVCMDARKAELNNKWRNMAISSGGTEKPFAITNPK